MHPDLYRLLIALGIGVQLLVQNANIAVSLPVCEP